MYWVFEINIYISNIFTNGIVSTFSCLLAPTFVLSTIGVIWKSLWWYISSRASFLVSSAWDSPPVAPMVSLTSRVDKGDWVGFWVGASFSSGGTAVGGLVLIYEIWIKLIIKDIDKTENLHQVLVCKHKCKTCVWDYESLIVHKRKWTQHYRRNL